MRWVKASERQPAASDGDVCGCVVCRRWESNPFGLTGWAHFEWQPEYDGPLEKDDFWLECAYTDVPGHRIRTVFLHVPPEVRDLAVRVFGNERIAADWLQDKCLALGGNPPVVVASRDPQEVINVLNRIEYGIYS